MTDETIVAVYDTPAHAESAVADLRAAGVAAEAISTQAKASAVSANPAREQSIWASLFGGEPDHDTGVYDRSVAGGATVVTVRTQGAPVDQVMTILESHHPIDMDERASAYGMARTPLAPPAGALAADDTLQLSEESLSIGKRVVNRGGARIRRFVVQTPVEQDVNLREERVTVERRPVTDGRSFTGEFGEKVIEMTETAEEPVVSKTARVYEEVGLRKQATERVETVRDTVRKEEVAVEQVPVTAPGTRAPKI